MAETAAAVTTPSTTTTESSLGTLQGGVVLGEQHGYTYENKVSPNTVRMMKLKVDGQELELPESEILALASQGKASNKRFQEAAATRREAEQIIAFAKENPKEFFAKTGMNARQWAEDFLLQEIQREQMSPEQKKAFENEQKLKEYEAKEKAVKDKAQQEQIEALERRHMEEYDTKFVAALAESGLPKTPFTVMRMAQLETVNLKKGLDLTASQLAKIVREDYIAEQKALYGPMDGDALLEMLGKEAAKKLNKAQYSKFKSGKTNTASAPVPEKKSSSDKSNPIQAWKAMQKKTRSLL